MVADMPLLLRAYLAATHLVPVAAKRHLQKRIARGKEDPDRWAEKLGVPSAPRPTGKLIWLNAVGLGEVLSLRGLIAAMADRTDAQFLVTSTTLNSAQVLAKNMPPRTQHQFLPLDAPRYRRAFLDHWQPDLCIWAEQEVWPGFVTDMAARDVPQAMVAARISPDAFARKRRAARSFAYLYNQMALRTAYDATSANDMQRLGCADLPVTGSLKSVAPPLAYDADDLAALQEATKDRFVWITAPSHAADEAVALAAHTHLLRAHPDALLIIAPRFAERTITCDLPMAVRSKGELPSKDQPVYLADTYGDLGTLYRIAQAVLIGGTHDATEGHSPWEAANLDTALFYGPHIDNFKSDFKDLQGAFAATEVTSPRMLSQALTSNLAPQIAAAKSVIAARHAAVDALAQDLLALT